MSTVMPRSALRHRPIQTTVPEWVIATAPRTRRGTPPASPARTLSSQLRHLHPLAIIGLSMLMTLLILWVVQGVWSWSSAELDTLRYGYPRTTQVDHVVGHGGVSHFITTNEHGQIYVLEIPGGDPAGSHLLVGPHLLGANADLAPAKLSFQGNPQHPDLLIEVQGIETHFQNTGKTYAPITP